MRYIITLIVFFLSGCDIKLDANTVDAKKYLSSADTRTVVYKKDSNTTFYNPFNFAHTDFGKLLLISIDDHPRIKTVELVVQDNTKGAFVVIYYHNGKVENYVNTHLSIDRKYLKPNQNWSVIEKQNFTYRLENTRDGISFFLDITIKSGERLEIDLRENQTRSKKYAFLAAVGADLNEVKRFPFIFLKDAGFIPIENTSIHFKINNKEMKITKVPVKVEGIKCYKTIYALTPLAFFWNEEQRDSLSSREIKPIQSTHKENATYTFLNHHGHKEIKQIVYRANKHFSTYTFSPAFPDIMAMQENTYINGRFCLGIDNINGIVCGEYSVSNKENSITIEINPKKCWQPMPGKDWVSLYHYTQKIKTLNKNKFEIKSEWIIEK